MNSNAEINLMRNGFQLSVLPLNEMKSTQERSHVQLDNDTRQRLENAKQNSGILEIYGTQRKVRLEDIEVLEQLSHGSCGTVHLSKYQSYILVMKKMIFFDVGSLRKVLMDLEVARLPSTCPHIVNFYGYFITGTEVTICMERMASCFDNVMRTTKQSIPENILGKLSVSVIGALDYLKKHHQIMHRDIKPSNILVSFSGVVKLCDFGISRELVNSLAQTREVGCYYYMAPERFASKPYDIRSDVWSFGITLVELATGKHPFHGSDSEVVSKILSRNTPILRTEDGFSPMFCNLVKQCLQFEAAKRPTFAELLNDPFITHYKTDETDVEKWLENVMFPLIS